MDPPREEQVFGRWLRKRRKALDLTQKELARRVGCSPATIRKLEAEERRPSRHVATALGEALGVPPQERTAFVRFARNGWSDHPTTTALPDLERPWMAGASGVDADGTVDTAPGTRSATEPMRVEAARDPAGRGQRVLAVVSRDAELERLSEAFDQALAGSGKVALVAGEAGQGKTTLLRAFAGRALAAQPDLLVATGSCNAYSGGGDPFLPFRQILQQLTGDLDTGRSPDAFERECALRLRQFLPRAVEALVEFGPGVVGTLLAPEPLRRRLTRAGLAVPDALEPFVPARASPLSGTFDVVSHAALRSATTRVLTAVADRRPLLLLLDDLQWVDPSSVDVLLHLAKAVAGHRVLLVGAYRATDIAVESDGVPHAMMGLLHEVERVNGSALIDLDRADGRAFLEAWLDTQPNSLDAEFREALWRQTGGHPLFTIELLRAMQERGDIVQGSDGLWTVAPTLVWDALPRRVSGALAERIGRLRADAREILRVGSVEGESFTAEVVAHVLGKDPRDVVATLGGHLAREQQLVTATEVRRNARGLVSRYRFRHELIQRFVYDTLDAGERSYLHEAVAVTVETLFQDEADPLILARQFDRAHLPGRAAGHYRSAGDRARRAAALDQAVTTYQAALERWSDPDPASRASLLHDLGECLLLRGQLEEAQAVLTEARTIFEGTGDRRWLGATEIMLGRIHYDLNHWQQAVDITLHAIEFLEGVPEAPERARAMLQVAAFYRLASMPHEALTWGERGLTLANQAGDAFVEMRGLNAVGTVLASAGPERRDEGLAMLKESRDIARRLALQRDAGGAGINLAFRLLAVGRLDEACEQLNDAIHYLRQHQNVLMEVWPVLELWRLDWRRGKWAEALERMPQIQALGKSEGEPNPGQLFVPLRLAAAWLDMGLAERAEHALARHEPVLQAVREPQLHVPYLREKLRVASARKRSDEADRHAAETLASVGTQAAYSEEVIPPVLTAVRWLVDRPTARVRWDAASAIRVLERTAHQYGSAAARGTLAEARGLLARTEGGADAAATYLREAGNAWGQSGFPFDEARARSAAARALSEAGKAGMARTERSRARKLLASLAAQLSSPDAIASFKRVTDAMLGED